MSTRTSRLTSSVEASWAAPIELLWIELLWVDADHGYRGLLRWTPHVVAAVHDCPGFEATDQKALAVRRFLLARPDRWRVVSDRDAGSIFAVERLPDAPRPPATRRAASRLKWKAHSGRFLVSEVLRLRRG